MIRIVLAIVPFVALMTSSCSREAPAVPGTATGSSVSPMPTAAETFDQMDKRAPVPLLPMMANHQKQNMREHLVAVQEIVAAVASDDFAAVEKAAAKIGFSDQMGQMCNHMGAGAPGFTEQALAFHHAADRIGEAAKAKDRARVLTELGSTLQACTSCHAAWKQQVVDDATWQRVTSMAPPSHGADHDSK